MADRGDDTFELHSVQVELEAVEKQIRQLLERQAELRAALESSRIPAILKDESVGAIVLHAGVNDIRLRQTEVLKRDFGSLIEAVRSTAPETRIIVSGPLPTLFRADGLHPSRVGAELLSDNISRTLRSI
ncbi:hypothetical protein QQF64_009555 [Cirrhinus molitorella]|uniref:SGNH hydrolase-type esterase domain-containing protein n=1 Tax=Cirrhinus molitorella TaxID=172907 RepID=A0ABR3M5K9_9TELE